MRTSGRYRGFSYNRLRRIVGLRGSENRGASRLPAGAAESL